MTERTLRVPKLKYDCKTNRIYIVYGKEKMIDITSLAVAMVHTVIGNDKSPKTDWTGL